jgi:hypothetical protein
VLGCPFRVQQFDRAVHTGSISLVAPDLKTAIINAYTAVGTAQVATLAQAKARAEEVLRPGVMTMCGVYNQGEECFRLLNEAQTQHMSFLKGQNYALFACIRPWHWYQR